MFSFKRLAVDDLPMVLAWRTNPRVTRYMVSDIENDLDKQVQWFKNLSDPYWVGYYGNRPIGVLNLQLNDASFGFYIGEDDATPLGGLMLPYFYNYLFANPRQHALYAEVMEGNEGVMKLHKFYGYTPVGAKKKQVEKYGKSHRVFLFRLERDKWLEQANRYGHMRAEF